MLQSDNGSEYKNQILSNFCLDYNIKHIFSSPYKPSANGVVEVTQKEIRKQIILDFIENEDDFDLNGSLLDAINIHNNNIHISMGYKPIELFNNTNEEVFDEVNKNIETAFIITDYESNYRSMIKGLDVKDTYQLYRDYLDNFRINHGRD